MVVFRVDPVQLFIWHLSFLSTEVCSFDTNLSMDMLGGKGTDD